MAIQFNCPYCTASIRVPDSAAGKQGTCPKCATKLLVPHVGAPPEPPKPSQSKPQESTAPAKAVPPPIPQEAVAGFPGIQTESTGLIQEPSMAHVVRRRAKRKGTNPLIPILLFGVVLGVLGYWMWKPPANLQGELPAEIVEDYTIPPGLIDKSAFEMPADEISSMMDEMKQNPPASVLIQDWMEMLLKPTDQGLEVLVRKTPATEVFRVKTSAVPAIRQFIQQHAEEITKHQATEFHDAMQGFLQDWRTSREKDLPFPTDSYRDKLGFNRLTGPTGYCLEAQIGSRAYRCVREASNGDLYFLLPTDTRKFVISGREMPDGSTIFPGRFTAEVNPPKSQESADTTEPPMESPASKQ